MLCFDLVQPPEHLAGSGRRHEHGGRCLARVRARVRVRGGVKVKVRVRVGVRVRIGSGLGFGLRVGAWAEG